MIPTIGLEVHAQLRTTTKIFCGCSAAFGAAPNSQTCAVCLGLPGALPVLNRAAVEHAVRAALALGCTVHLVSVFARKHYFYPDLPKGYQISQYDRPLATGGAVPLDVAGGEGAVRIVRVHLEEDAGKSLHNAGTDDRQPSAATGVDFNRSGVPLIEIVTAPDITSGAMAAACFSRIRDVLVSIGVTDGNMEEGSLRCDANVSVRQDDTHPLGVKVEIKNINSFRYVQRAIEFEIERQSALASRGRLVVAETRLWDSAAGETYSMRTKEDAHDYRYFPEPDLPPLLVTEAWLGELRRTLDDLPESTRDRFVRVYGLPPYDAGVLTQSAPLAAYFEATAAAAGSAKAASNWIMGELLGRLNADRTRIDEVPIDPTRLAGLIRLVESGRITGPIAKQVFERMFAGEGDAHAIVEAEGLSRIDDDAAIDALVAQTIMNNPKPVAQYREGKRQTFGFLVGQVMKTSSGKADPEKVAAALRRALE